MVIKNIKPSGRRRVVHISTPLHKLLGVRLLHRYMRFFSRVFLNMPSDSDMPSDGGRSVGVVFPAFYSMLIEFS